jgi:hypothetical protein
MFVHVQILSIVYSSALLCCMLQRINTLLQSHEREIDARVYVRSRNLECSWTTHNPYQNTIASFFALKDEGGSHKEAQDSFAGDQYTSIRLLG